MSKNCTPLWRKAHAEVKMLKKLRVREHFLKFRCWKIARRCGEKHIRKWKCIKHDVFGVLLYVKMSKKWYAAVAKSTFGSVRCRKNCTRLWRKAHLEVNMLKKNWGSGSTFWSSDVDKMHAAVAKSTFWSENVQNTAVSEHFSNIWCRQIVRRCGKKRILKWKCTKHVSSGQFFEVLMSKNQSV